MENHKLIHQDSGVVEYGSPPAIVNLARQVMGGIDLDVATSTLFNDAIVKAGKIWTVEDDGLSKPWRGRVWMNHPFSKGEKACPADRSKCKKKVCRTRGYHIDVDTPGNADWIEKLVEEYMMGRATQACNICYAATSEAWFRPLLRFPQCFIHGRVNYLLPDGTTLKGVTKGSVVTYMGPEILKFAKLFNQIGQVKIAI